MVGGLKIQICNNCFWQKYQANSFYTYQNSKDFNQNIMEIIKKTSPSYIHQIAIPNFEMDRLINRYNNYSEIEKNSFIIIDKNNKFWHGENISDLEYKFFSITKTLKFTKKDLINCLD